MDDHRFTVPPLRVSSAAAKKAAGSRSESSGDKSLKEGVNGEVEEDATGNAKGGPELASGSKPRVCRRAESSEAGGPGELTLTPDEARKKMIYSSLLGNGFL